MGQRNSARVNPIEAAVNTAALNRRRGAIRKRLDALAGSFALVLWLLPSPGRAQTQMPDVFSWGDVQNHPLSGSGAVYDGLPNGNYLTPNEDQARRCESGCILYATIGNMEIQYKIQHQDPQMTLNLSEAAMLDAHDVLNMGLGSGWLCANNCAKGGGMRPPSCIPALLKSEGVPREDNPDPVIYKIGTYELFDADEESWDQIRERLLHGPITGTIQVDNTESGQKYLYWGGPCEPGYPCTEIVYHRVVLVGYKQQSHPTGGPTNRQLLVKNSWGLNDYGFSDYVWISWDSGSLYKDSPWLQISAMTASYATADTDGDGLPNHRDICPHVPSGRQSSGGIVQPNLDNDSLGDECDPDMDGDLVLDIHDCHPTNRYIGFDLDRDGACDDLDRVVTSTGAPYTTVRSHPLHTPAFKDYKDVWTIGTENTAHAEDDGDTEQAVDLPLTTVCSNQCVRVAAIPAALRPSGFNLSECQALCDPAHSPRDNCTPMSLPNVADAGVNEWHACSSLRSCATGDKWGNFCDLGSVTVQASTCRTFWHNPADGQVDSDGDGYGDLCDSELVLRNLSMKVDTETYRAEGGELQSDIQLNFLLCYQDEYEISFDAWGGRSRDGQYFGATRDGAAISACACPRASWDATCDTYCPTQGENPSSGDAAYNPGNDNAAWDPISSPDDCMSKLDIVAGVDYHLCRDRYLHFRAEGFEHSPRYGYHWRWQPFYDADREQNGALVQHPNLRFTESDPQLVKVRVSWPERGETPAQDEKAFLSQPEQMRSGCINLADALRDDLFTNPQWMLPPGAQYAPQLMDPNQPVSAFENLTRPRVALALFGEHVVALDAVSGSLVAARPISYGGSARLKAADAAPNAAARGVIAAEDLPEIVDTSGGTGKTPAIIALNDGKLWLGLPALGNAWMTWEEAYGANSLPAEPIKAVVSSSAGHLMLLCRGEATDAPLAAYLAKGSEWELTAKLPAVVMGPNVKGTSVVLHPGGRQVYFAGGEGPGWDALLHRWDLLSGQFEPIDLPQLEEWDAARSGLGVCLSGETLYLAGPELARVDLLGKRAQVLAADLPDNTGAHPYLYVDADGQRLALAPIAGDKPFVVSSLALDEPGAEWEDRQLLNDEPQAGAEDDGCSCATQRETRGWPGLLLLLAIMLGVRARRRL